MQPSICARMTSGLTATPQSTAQTTRSTLTLPSLHRHLGDLCDEGVERLVHRDALREPARSGLPQPALSAASLSTPAARGLLLEQREAERERVAGRPRRRARPSSFPSRRRCACCRPSATTAVAPRAPASAASPSSIGRRTAVWATPSTEVGSMPSLIIIVPSACRPRSTGRRWCAPRSRRGPCASIPAFTACTYIGR